MNGVHQWFKYGFADYWVYGLGAVVALLQKYDASATLNTDKIYSA